MAGTCTPYLLLAHHRSGSNFVTDLLQAHPQVECLNEPFSMHAPFFRTHDLQPWSAAEFDAQQLHPSLPAHGEIHDYLQALRRYLTGASPSRVIGFKETGLFGQLDWLRAYLPGLKLVFLWRDPRAIVSSVMRSELMGFWRYHELVPPAFARLFPHRASLAFTASQTADVATLAAMSVVVRYELARRALGSFDHLVLGLDAVARAPAHALDAMARLLGVEPHPSPVQFARARWATNRGGTFSSFRDPAGVSLRWQAHLQRAEVDAIERVLHAVNWCEPSRWPGESNAYQVDTALH
ncbi:sulfotransferase [Ideonella sp.]|uniref:sulfotransferase n=1 Tax=Ideonella sp. TaxID=1929293 RepID=UPI0035B06F3E